jgi:hypothetical protein
MYTVTRSASTSRSIAAELRLVPEARVPLITAKALTFTAQEAQKAIVAAMPGVFAGGATRYTLNSTRIVPATPDSLQARVAVKNDAAAAGNVPENYLLPQVSGGPRREKRFERAMRYAGLLANGARAILSTSAQTDTFGNLKRGELQRILTATRSAFDPYQRKSDSARSRRNARNAPYFAVGEGRIAIEGGEMVRKRGKLPAGIYKRTGKRSVEPVLIFTRKQPRYAPRLPFGKLAEAAARQQFPAIFLRLLRRETSAR